MTIKPNVMCLDDSGTSPNSACDHAVATTEVVATQTESCATTPPTGSPCTADHFIIKNGIEYAGTHIIIDLWGASRLDDLVLMEDTMRKAISEAKATLLHIHLHHFTPNEGISGVAVLAESHISVHTWPERCFAAFDVFMCGDAEPQRVVPVLQAAFKPERVQVNELMRGDTSLLQSDDQNSME